MAVRVHHLWLDFVNTDYAGGSAGGHAGMGRGRREDVLDEITTFLAWLQMSGAIDGDRVASMARRAEQQPSGAAAALADARRVRAALRALAERSHEHRVRADAAAEINRVLGRSAGTRRLELHPDGQFLHSFAPVGDAFHGLMIPIVESAADACVAGDLVRIRRCADARCAKVFFDTSKNGKRRWCTMATCGNRAKAARHRAREL